MTKTMYYLFTFFFVCAVLILSFLWFLE